MKFNIPKSMTDPTYRYKRDQIDITVQNIKGGITKFNNLDVISKQLGDEPSFIIKFFKKKTNTSITDNDKGIIINKVENVDKLEEYLEEFIQKYTLCPKCSNPEFTLEKCTRICRACGIARTFV